MSHEQSETIKGKDGRWYNVFGKKTGKYPQPLTPQFEFERESYDSEPEASMAAGRRSYEEGLKDLVEKRPPSNPSRP